MARALSGAKRNSHADFHFIDATILLRTAGFMW
jgi:hypothetical protein